MNYGKKLSFITSWWNEIGCNSVEFVLNFFPEDNSVELFNNQTKKLFLKRTVQPELLL